MYHKLKFICFTVFGFLFLNPDISEAQNLNLKLVGDESSGFQVDIYDGDELIITNAGEFSLFLSNLDLSVKVEIRDWKSSTFTETDKSINLEKEIYLPEFDLNLTANVIYELVNSALIKKTVSIFQIGIPTLYFRMDISGIPSKPPSQYVTFEHSDFPGGFVHELYPSAGFVTEKGNVVGFLTDPGYKNHFTRTTRRRFSGRGGGMIGMRILPDADLLSIPTQHVQSLGLDFIRYSFGNSWNLDRGDSVELDLPAHFEEEGDVQVNSNKGLIEMLFTSDGKAGINTIIPMEDQKVYTISFLAKGDSPVMLKLYRMKNGEKTEELEHGIKYIDNFP